MYCLVHDVWARLRTGLGELATVMATTMHTVSSHVWLKPVCVCHYIVCV